MMFSVETLNTVVGAGNAVIQLLILCIGAALLVENYFQIKIGILDVLAQFYLHCIFAVASLAVLLSLFYSDVLGYIPCQLCWYQRVFLYPQAVIAGVALARGLRSVADFLLALSIPGALVALYHHYLQMGGRSFVPCSASEAGGECAKRFFLEFGYITFPLMSFVVFIFIILLVVLAKRRTRMA